MWHPDMPLEYRNAIVTGDGRELAKRIPDESVDLIFTDPPYPLEYLPLYGWLAETAARVLKPGGLCLAMAGQLWLPQIIDMLTEHLTFHWIFCMWLPGNLSPVFPRRLMGQSWKPILAFSRGNYSGPFFPSDVLQSGERDKRFHSWGQHEASTAWVLLRTLADVIWEPFTGGGTVPAVCKMLGRNYIAFEIDPDTAEKARQRVAQTQVPWFVEMPEQLMLFDGER